MSCAKKYFINLDGKLYQYKKSKKFGWKGELWVFSWLFVCFVALRPKLTAMVMAGQSVHLTILFLGKLEQAVNQYFVHKLSLETDNNPSWMIQLKGGEWS